MKKLCQTWRSHCRPDHPPYCLGHTIGKILCYLRRDPSKGVLCKLCKKKWLFSLFPFRVLHSSLPIRWHLPQALWEIFKGWTAFGKTFNDILKAAAHSFFASCQHYSPVSTSYLLNFSALKMHLGIERSEPENERDGELPGDRKNTFSNGKRKLLCESCLGWRGKDRGEERRKEGIYTSIFEKEASKPHYFLYFYFQWVSPHYPVSHEISVSHKNTYIYATK